MKALHPRKRRPRAIRKNAHKKKRCKNPTASLFGPGGIEGLVDLAGEMFLLSMLRRFGIRGRDIVAFTRLQPNQQPTKMPANAAASVHAT